MPPRPNYPPRRCEYVNSEGQQCETMFAPMQKHPRWCQSRQVAGRAQANRDYPRALQVKKAAAKQAEKQEP